MLKKKKIDMLTEVMRKFLKEQKLPKPGDKEGEKKLRVAFIDKFGKTFFASLDVSDHGLYTLAAFVKSGYSGGKKTRKNRKVRSYRKGIAKPPAYTSKQKTWFKNYQGKLEDVLKEYCAAFPGALKRSAAALQWQVMHSKGKWNPERGRKSKRGRRMKRSCRRWTSAEIASIEVYADKKLPRGAMRKIARKFNKEFGHLGKRSAGAIALKITELGKKVGGVPIVAEITEVMTPSKTQPKGKERWLALLDVNDQLSATCYPHYPEKRILIDKKDPGYCQILLDDRTVYVGHLDPDQILTIWKEDKRP